LTPAKSSRAKYDLESWLILSTMDALAGDEIALIRRTAWRFGEGTFSAEARRGDDPTFPLILTKIAPLVNNPHRKVGVPFRPYRCGSTKTR
jgi:hypothetical protein